MTLFRAALAAVLRPGEHAPTLTAFPRLGCTDALPRRFGGDKTDDDNRAQLLSEYALPEVLVNPHPRFGALARSIRARRGGERSRRGGERGPSSIAYAATPAAMSWRGTKAAAALNAALCAYMVFSHMRGGGDFATASQGQYLSAGSGLRLATTLGYCALLALAIPAVGARW